MYSTLEVLCPSDSVLSIALRWSPLQLFLFQFVPKYSDPLTFALPSYTNIHICDLSNAFSEERLCCAYWSPISPGKAELYRGSIIPFLRFVRKRATMTCRGVTSLDYKISALAWPRLGMDLHLLELCIFSNLVIYRTRGQGFIVGYTFVPLLILVRCQQSTLLPALLLLRKYRWSWHETFIILYATNIRLCLYHCAATKDISILQQKFAITLPLAIQWFLLLEIPLIFSPSYHSRQLNCENGVYSLETPSSSGVCQQTTMVSLLTSYAPHTHCAPQTHVTYTCV